MASRLFAGRVHWPSSGSSVTVARGAPPAGAAGDAGSLARAGTSSRVQAARSRSMTEASTRQGRHCIDERIVMGGFRDGWRLDRARKQRARKPYPRVGPITVYMAHPSIDAAPCLPFDFPMNHPVRTMAVRRRLALRVLVL